MTILSSEIGKEEESASSAAVLSPDNPVIYSSSEAPSFSSSQSESSSLALPLPQMRRHAVWTKRERKSPRARKNSSDVSLLSGI